MKKDYIAIANAHALMYANWIQMPLNLKFVMHKVKHTVASQLCGLLLFVRKRMLIGIKEIVFLVTMFTMV